MENGKMTAEEMFKKLGYRKEERDNEIVYEFLQESEDIIYQRGYIDYMIIFNTQVKKLHITSINTDEDDDFIVGVDVLKTINKQIEELGWEKKNDNNGKG